MPFLFGKAYTKYTGIPSGKSPKPKNLLVGIICSIILVFTVAILLKSLQISMIIDAIVFGLIIGFGIILSVNLPINQFNNYPLGLFFIDSGMPFVGIIINSIILTLIK
jgi:Kef-type K+ transport system membrane component KefB